MLQPLPTNLPDFTQASLLVIGDVMLDRYWFGDTSRISPEAPALESTTITLTGK